MTFTVSNDGVKNSEGTKARLNRGKVTINGNFENTGDVEIDVLANLKVAGNVVNSGNFSIKDYLTEDKYHLIEEAIKELQAEPREHLTIAYDFLKKGNEDEANKRFKKFLAYLKDHPSLVTGSISILLQMFLS